jgi:hypothetical protein
VFCGLVNVVSKVFWDWFAGFFLVKVLILFYFVKISKKGADFSKKRLRVVRTGLRTPSTGGAEAHNGTPDRATG